MNGFECNQATSITLPELFLLQCCGPAVFDDQQRVGGHRGHQQHGTAGRRPQFLQLLPPAQFPQGNADFLAQDCQRATHQVCNARVLTHVTSLPLPQPSKSPLFTILQRLGEGVGPPSLAHHLAACSVSDAHGQQSGGLQPVGPADLAASRPADLVSFSWSLQTSWALETKLLSHVNHSD